MSEEVPAASPEDLELVVRVTVATPVASNGGQC
jgi:hypothetical protein